jgi:hypothetical protein
MTGDTVHNHASGNARFGLQVGVVHGDVKVYQYSEGTPEEQFEIGYNNLQAGIARKAEELIGESIARGNGSDRTLFYYALAVLSGRSINEVMQHDFAKLEGVFSSPHFEGTGPYGQSLLVVKQVIWCLIEQDSTGAQPHHQNVDAALAAFDGLPPERQAEISRHLDMVLAGVIQDRMDHLESRSVQVGREARDRRTRAVKFFLPDPAPPRLRASVSPPFGAGTVLRMVVGALALAVLGYVVVSVLLRVARPGPWAAAGGLLLVIVAMAWASLELHFRRSWRDRLRRRFENQDVVHRDPWDGRYPEEQAARFTRRIYEIYAAAFAVFGPSGPDAARWAHDTRGLHAALANETALTYGPPGALAPEGLEWLAEYQVRRIAAAWAAGTFHSYRKARRVPTLLHLARYLSLPLAILSLLGFTVQLFALDWQAALLALLMFGVAGLTLRRSVAWRYAEWRIAGRDRAEAAEQLAGETVAYRQRVAYLANRPADWEMATWLDYDTRFIKLEALKQYGLTNNDVINHLVLTEAAPECLRAKVPGGPPRYSQYIVQLFLLTENGVRQQTIELDFLGLVLGSQHRLNFRYDTLASATVDEVGVRFNGRKKRVVLLGQDHDLDREDPNDALVFSQSFRLTLTSGTSKDILIENYKRWADELESEDQARLVELAMETSGVSTALRILESVAAEGRDWIAQERRRYLRALKRHAEDGGARPGLEGTAAPAALEASPGVEDDDAWVEAEPDPFPEVDDENG